MKKQPYRVGVLILLLLGYVTSAAQAQLSADSAAMIHQALSTGNEETPGGVLTIHRGGQRIFHHAWGMADLERSVPNGSQTLFEAGSVSKQFTAAAVLLLILEGKLALTDDIRRYIPELPDYGHPVTVHQLLTHTSGIKDWGTVVRMGGWPRTTRVYTQQHVYDVIFRQNTLNFVSGTEFAYSNSNHNLMVLLVERISGRDFEEFTQTEIFGPVGMEHTSWRTDFRRVVPGRAVAYRTSPAGEPEQFMPFENTYGHAALLTTTEDLIRWNQWLTDLRWGEAFEQLRLLPYTFANGKQTEYTCGALFVRSISGKLEICHTGSTAGYRSWLAYYPELALSVAYLSNDAAVPSVAIARLISDLFVGRHPAFTLPMKENPASIPVDDPANRADLAGIYQRTDGPQVLEWKAQGDTLYLARDPVWNGMYNDPWKAGTRKFRFTGDTGGEIEVVTPTGRQRYHQVPSTSLADQRLADLPGQYVSEEAGGTVSVDRSAADGTLWMTFENGQSVRFVQAYIDRETISLIAENHIMLRLVTENGHGIIGFDAYLSQESFAMARADRLVFEKITDIDNQK